MSEFVNQESSEHDHLLFDDVKNVDADKDFGFQLRGGGINPLIDAANPLLGMALRIRHLSHCDNVQGIYKQCVEEVKSLEIELIEKGYEHAIILTFRYVLCAFIDEAVMSTSWGADSVWVEHSLLIRFHNETWGGDKVFTILSRLDKEPERYRLLLEFIFVCLCLGFEGRYKVMDRGRENHEKVIANLYQTLRNLSGNEQPELLATTEHVEKTQYRVSRQWPVWSVPLGFFVALSITFLFYIIQLNNKSANVLEKLHQILAQ